MANLGEPERYIDLWTGQPRDADAVLIPGGGFAWLMRV